MNLTQKESLFLYETILAIVLGKSRVGSKNYSTTLSRIEANELLKKLQEKEIIVEGN